MVIATHSPKFIDSGLPRSAVRVLYCETDGSIEIDHNRSLDEAFRVLDTSHDGPTIFVEDLKAQTLVAGMLEKKLGGDMGGFVVRPLPGGVDRIYEDIQSLCRIGGNFFVFLDGDQKRSSEPVDPQLLSQKTRTDRTALLKIATELADRALSFDSGTDGILDFLEFFHERAGYLPGSTPEDVVTAKPYVSKLLGLYNPVLGNEEVDEMCSIEDTKGRLAAIQAHLPPKVDAYTSLFGVFVGDESGDAWNQIAELIDGAREGRLRQQP